MREPALPAVVTPFAFGSLRAGLRPACAIREDFRQVDRARAEALAAAEAVEVEQARDVGAGDVLDARVGEGAEPREAHPGRERGMRDREGAAEAAALVRPLGRDERELVDGAEELLERARGPARRAGRLARRAEPELAQAVAALEHGHAVREARAELDAAEHAHQELAELVRALRL